jgi:hypothetical protein
MPETQFGGVEPVVVQPHAFVVSGHVSGVGWK